MNDSGEAMTVKLDQTVSNGLERLADAFPPGSTAQANFGHPLPFVGLSAMDGVLDSLLSAHLRLCRFWFLALLNPHKIDGLPLAGASRHDLPARPEKRA